MFDLKYTMKEIRKSRGIQSKELATALGISPAYLVMIEKGIRAVPLDFFTKINNYLALSHDEMQKLVDAIEKHPLSNKNARQRERIHQIRNEIIQIASALFARLMSQLTLDVESQNAIAKLIEILTNLKDRIFKNEEYEIMERMI